MVRKTRNGRSYLYKSVRRGGKTRSEYVGRGDFAELMELMDRDDARRRQEDRDQAREERDRAIAEDGRVVRVADLLGTLADMLMAELGYRRHKRGRWRKGRTMGETLEVNLEEPAPGRGVLTLDQGKQLSARLHAREPKALKQWSKIKDRAIAGDKGGVQSFLSVYRADRGELAYFLAGLTEAPMAMMLEKAFGSGQESEMVRETLADEAGQVAARLAGENPGAIERLLADRAAVCWVDVLCADLRDATSVNSGQSVATAALQNRRRDSANARYLAALKALAAVRRVSVVALQVNIDRREQAEQGREVGPDSSLKNSGRTVETVSLKQACEQAGRSAESSGTRWP